MLLAPLVYGLSASASLQSATLPPTLGGFEDVAPIVLSSNPANRGISSMSLVEVAHLWRLSSTAPTGILIEIGRERGGSTLVIAAAMREGSFLFSYDPQAKNVEQGLEFDRLLSDTLLGYELAAKVRISLDDSHTTDLPSGEYGLVLVDGDPTYAGTRADFERFCRRLAPGGRALFHDAVAGGPRERELARLLSEIDSDEAFKRQPDVGTFADYRRCAS